MKIRLIVLACMAAIMYTTSCKKDEVGNVTFPIEEQVTFVIPPNSILDLPAVVSPGVTTDWEQDFENNDSRKDRLRELKLTSLTLNITDPPGKTFKFLESIEVYIKADGLDETRIAYYESIPENIGQSLALVTVDVDLAPYAQKDNFTLRTKAEPRELNSDEVTVRADMKFRATANVLE